MQAVLITNDRNPDLPFSDIRNHFWLRPNTPYGNLTLKLFRLNQRIEEANRHLLDSFTYWYIINIATLQQAPMHPDAMERHFYAIEIAILMMRRTADEFIALVSCLSDWEGGNTYPQRIRIGEIGELLKRDASHGPKLYEPHIDMRQHLNEIANAFKHSFVQTDLNLVGTDEPMVNALSLHYNKLDSGVRFYSVPLADLARDFSKFYFDIVMWLQVFSERYRPS